MRIAICATTAMLLATTLLVVTLAAVALEPSSGPGHRIIDAIEERIGESEELHYYAHQILGKVFSLCPCTAGLSREQYRKAAFDRPR